MQTCCFVIVGCIFCLHLFLQCLLLHFCLSLCYTIVLLLYFCLLVFHVKNFIVAKATKAFVYNFNSKRCSIFLRECCVYSAAFIVFIAYKLLLMLKTLLTVNVREIMAKFHWGHLPQSDSKSMPIMNFFSIFLCSFPKKIFKFL